MRKLFRVIGWLSASIGGLLGLLGLLAFPDTGLMFALPYFFLLPGLVLAVSGVLLLRATRRVKDANQDPRA